MAVLDEKECCSVVRGVVPVLDALWHSEYMQLTCLCMVEWPISVTAIPFEKECKD